MSQNGKKGYRIENALWNLLVHVVNHGALFRSEPACGVVH